MAANDVTGKPHDELADLADAYESLELLMPHHGPEVCLLHRLNVQFRREIQRLGDEGLLS